MRKIAVIGLTFALAMLTGCATMGRGYSGPATGGMDNQVETVEPALHDSLDTLNETTANLTNRANENDKQTQELLANAEENQRKLEDIEKQIAEMKAILERQCVTVEQPNALGNSVTGPIPAQTEEQPQYKTAQEAYTSGNYDKAIQLFDAIVRQYPQSESAPNSQFWKAKSYLQMQRYQEAIQEFDSLRALYPASPKIPYAIHNQAVANARIGEKEKAKQLLQQLLDQYPLSPAAEAAQNDLNALN